MSARSPFEPGSEVGSAASLEYDLFGMANGGVFLGVSDGDADLRTITVCRAGFRRQGCGLRTGGGRAWRQSATRRCR